MRPAHLGRSLVSNIDPKADVSQVLSYTGIHKGSSRPVLTTTSSHVHERHHHRYRRRHHRPHSGAHIEGSRSRCCCLGGVKPPWRTDRPPDEKRGCSRRRGARNSFQLQRNAEACEFLWAVSGSDAPIEPPSRIFGSPGQYPISARELGACQAAGPAGNIGSHVVYDPVSCHVETIFVL